MRPAGTVYSGAVNISVASTLQAIAYDNGLTDSTVTSGVYLQHPVRRADLQPGSGQL